MICEVEAVFRIPGTESAQLLVTVNSLMFARYLFGEIYDHFQTAKINTCKRNSCTWINKQDN